MPLDRVERDPSEGSNEDIGEAAAFFVARLEELMRTHKFVDDRSGRRIKINGKNLCEKLSEQVQGRKVAGMSQAQIYRILDGKVSPPITVVWEIARLFNVSPGSLLPPE
jgi:hypothetical protein